MCDRTRQVAYATATRASKLGSMWATYASQSSCPRTCPLRGAGCYAESGHVALAMPRGPASPTACALAEADAIDALPADGRPLRLHVVGDCATAVAAGIVGASCSRRGGKNYTYTHAHQAVPRTAWGRGLCVSASLERLSQLPAAWARGYRSFACVVDGATMPTRPYRVGPVRVLPCPHALGRVASCEACGICMSEPTGGGRCVLLPAHGARKSTVLRVIGQ